ncbi:MAG: transposase [Clostridia bacterium]|nr:transposase [Clostridia bacterium]
MEENKKQRRKEIRIKEYNYSQSGMYFITICTKNRRCILSNITYNKKTNATQIDLLSNGKVADKYIKSINKAYKNICINYYVIMPNHIHFICEILTNGSSRTPTPTNATIPALVSTFKRLTNKEINNKIWQRNYYEHIVRNEKEYIEIIQYIEKNPINWNKDKYFM